MLGRRDNIQLYLFYRYLYQYVIMTKYMNFINLLVPDFVTVETVYIIISTTSNKICQKHIKKFAKKLRKVNFTGYYLLTLGHCGPLR